MRWHRLTLLLALTGCGGGGVCPQVGCTSELVLQLPPGVTIGRACVADVCTMQLVDGALRVPIGRRADGDSATVTVTLGGGPTPYAGSVPLQRTRPNGAACPPVCVNGTARVDASGRITPVASP